MLWQHPDVLLADAQLDGNVAFGEDRCSMWSWGIGQLCRAEHIEACGQVPERCYVWDSTLIPIDFVCTTTD